MRVDVVFDRYNKQTIKSSAYKKRTGTRTPVRRNVESRSQAIGQLDRFILSDENKAGLSHFLSTQLSERFPNEQGRELVLRGGFVEPTQVWSSSGRDVSRLSATGHEEADTRMLLHAKEASEQGYGQTIIVSRDTDVLVLLVAHHRPHLSPSLWMQKGTAKKKCYVPIHQVDLSEAERSSLLGFHAITGSDSTSQFANIGKPSAWKEFVKTPQLLQNLGTADFPDQDVLNDAEAFICKFDPNTSSRSIGQVRCAVFQSTKRTLENLPPTRDALVPHVKRSHYQCLVWKRALETHPQLPSVVDSGWRLVESDTGNAQIEP